MRRAATYLTSVALLGLLSPLAMAKADATQVYKSGVQLVAVNNHLPHATIVATPRSATQHIEISPAAQQYTFFSEFYTHDNQTGALTPLSVPVSVASKRSIWTEQRVRFSSLSATAKKLAFNLFRR